MKVLCGFTLFCCLPLVVLATNIPCPKVTRGCECLKILENLKVECSHEAGITEIPSWIPNNTAELKFDNCDIQVLSGSSFKKLVKLKNLDILNQKNQVTVDDSEVFQGLNSLEHVNLNGNNIVSLPSRLFANISSLKYVSLDRNPLLTLPDDLFESSPNVQTLIVSNTRLDKDVLAKIGTGHFGKNIGELLISGTFIQRLKDDMFSGLPKLTRLRLFRCEIESVGADILKGTKVSDFILNNNPIKFIDENALGDSKVTQFECSNCRLTSKVAFNNGFLKKITGLYRVNLQNNNLTYIPKDAFTNLKSLSIIDLSNNSITTIEENPYANLPDCNSATCVLLHDNPLNCDCNLAWLRLFADKLEGNEFRWKCAQPKNVAGKSLVSLKLDGFCCVHANSTRKCGLPNRNKAWGVSAHIVVAIVSQIVVIFGIPLLFA